MTEFIKKYGCNVYSQNGEDGIIEEVVKRVKGSVAVEFGAADGYYCSNTAVLRACGWKVYMYDLHELPGLVEFKQITPENVNELPECDLLSIDIDGNDYAVWKAYKGKPKVVIIEINSSLNPDVHHFSLDHGSSFVTMNELAESKGYFLLCHTGNCIYVLNEYKSLFPDADKTFDRSWQ